jgi:hypothetical protein
LKKAPLYKIYLSSIDDCRRFEAPGGALPGFERKTAQFLNILAPDIFSLLALVIDEC